MDEGCKCPERVSDATNYGTDSMPLVERVSRIADRICDSITENGAATVTLADANTIDEAAAHITMLEEALGYIADKKHLNLNAAHDMRATARAAIDAMRGK